MTPWQSILQLVARTEDRPSWNSMSCITHQEGRAQQCTCLQETLMHSVLITLLLATIPQAAQ